METKGRAPIVGVMGGGSAAPEVRALAAEAGRLIAGGGAILLCGGGGGVMEAAARGAKAGTPPGATVGILPGKKGESTPNAFIDCAIFTGLRDARNYINVVTSDVLIALAGGPGTLSEIGLGLKVGTPVVGLGSWQFLEEAGLGLRCHDDAVGAVEAAFELIGCRPGEKLSTPLRFPEFPDQTDQRDALARFIDALTI